MALAGKDMSWTCFLSRKKTRFCQFLTCCCCLRLFSSQIKDYIFVALELGITSNLLSLFSLFPFSLFPFFSLLLLRIWQERSDTPPHSVFFLSLFLSLLFQPSRKIASSGPVPPAWSPNRPSQAPKISPLRPPRQPRQKSGSRSPPSRPKFRLACPTPRNVNL